MAHSAHRSSAQGDEHTNVRPELRKQRELRFHPLPPGQAERARQLLADLPGLSLAPAGPFAVRVCYCLRDHRLQELDGLLQSAGLHLDNGLYARITRALAYYCEDIQSHALNCPPRLLKRSHEVFVRAYDAHPHGDHDDTPPELRDYR